jgi:succinate-semialdehyde dehydrogenase/glutarate-semialdehyde dehydrogenase
MMNMGEACVATKRVIVVGKERGRQVLDGLAKRLGSLKAGDPANPETSIGPIVSERALKDLLAQIQGRQGGGRAHRARR